MPQPMVLMSIDVARDRIVHSFTLNAVPDGIADASFNEVKRLLRNYYDTNRQAIKMPPGIKSSHSTKMAIHKAAQVLFACKRDIHTLAIKTNIA